MSFTANKKILGVAILVLCISLITIYLLGFLGINAYDKGDGILLTSNSLTKRLNIAQVYNPDYPAVPYLIKPAAFDDLNQSLPPHNDLFLGLDDNNFILNLQYSNWQSFIIKKEDVNDFIRKSYDTSKVSNVRVFWGAYNVYFPIICKWNENGVYDCIRVDN